MSATRTRPVERVVEERVTGGAKRFGYLLAAALNGVFLWIVHQLLDWGWPGFLTPEFDDVLPIVTVSFVAGVVANLAYAWNDRWPVKPVGEVTTAAIGFAVAVRTWQVFPFDFSAHDADWSWLVRMILVIVMIGAAIGAIAEFVRLAKGAPPEDEPTS